MNFDFLKTSGALLTNARIRWLPDCFGVYQPYEIVAFDRPVFVPAGWERTGCNSDNSYNDDIIEVINACVDNSSENRRKSYNRARNKLFDILLCTLSFDCFVTLTLSSEKVDRYDYGEVVKRLNRWLDNRVRRNSLVYAIVPEKHKDGAIHFHGLMNFSALKTERAYSPHTLKPLFDNSGREMYNILDFSLGFSSVIPLSGDNARIAAAKYCYKYITKTHGEKVGGRYYLSGGNLGRPRYTYCNVDYESLDGREYIIGNKFVCVKKKRI